MRKNYLDNIRWATVLIVLVYHVCYIFNGVGVFGGIPGSKSIAVFDMFTYAVYPWFMVLLFIVAGISARYSLQTRTYKQFIRERAVNLLIPSTLGLFVIHWVSGYLNIKMGGGLADIPAFLLYPISVISGTGALWFIQMLFLFSCIIVLLKKLDKSDRIWHLCAKTNIIVVLALFVLIWAASQILNMPVVTVYRFGIYFAAFLIGYYVFSHDKVQTAIEVIRIPMLIAAVAGAVFYTYHYYGSNYTAPECQKSLVTNIYIWVVVLAVLGCAKKYFNKETAFIRYMTKSSFGIYILHYPVLIVTCYFLHYHCHISALWNYVIALAADIVLTFALYEGIKRIPFIRYLVLGQKAPVSRTQ
jgi:Predicted acyltransferases